MGERWAGVQEIGGEKVFFIIFDRSVAELWKVY